MQLNKLIRVVFFWATAAYLWVTRIQKIMTENEMTDLDTASTTTSESEKTCSQLRDRDVTLTSEYETSGEASALKRKIDKLEKENEMLRESNMKKNEKETQDNE